MKARPFILRLAAFFLILVFSQKAGTGLFLHNWFHTNNTDSSKSLPDDSKQGNEVNYACSCIDDFLMPFDEVAAPVYSPFVASTDITLSFYNDETPFHSPALSFLRGPPAFNL